jgi:cytochrome c biogenesis protein CcdA
MDFTPFLLAGLVGFTHAFELDHLVAVSSMVTRRRNVWSAVQDGIYWGLGHTLTILSVGAIILLGRLAFVETDFRFFEAAVGIMLIAMGMYRLIQLNRPQVHDHPDHSSKSRLNMAFGVGLIHGIAGSGALLVSVLATVQSPVAGLVYLVIFGIGSVLGMMAAAGIFSIPFSQNIGNALQIKRILTILSSLLCIGLGFWVFFENIR